MHEVEIVTGKLIYQITITTMWIWTEKFHTQLQTASTNIVYSEYWSIGVISWLASSHHATLGVGLPSEPAPSVLNM
jgi:hypothetical protein